MNAIFDNFTAEELRNFKVKKHGLLSFEVAESLDAQKQRRKNENLFLRNIRR